MVRPTVEDFLKDLRPAALTADQVTDYLQRMSARADLAEWQVRQIVDAVRLLLIDLAQVSAGKGAYWDDWDDWWEGQRILPPEHATIARSTAISAEDGGGPRAIGVPRFSRSAQTFPILEDLARTIRAMQYSIRTEQS